MKKKEKDPNLIAKFELAIEKQYGKEAIVHPRSNWDDAKEQSYLEQAEEVSKKNSWETEPQLFFIGTKHEAFKHFYFKPGSTVIDPFFKTNCCLALL